MENARFSLNDPSQSQSRPSIQSTHPKSVRFDLHSAAPEGEANLEEGFAAGLTSTETSSAAALAIKTLCQDCGRKMAPFLDALTQLYSQVQEAGTFGAKQQVFTLDEEDVQQVWGQE